jgi:hypothetical protein
MAMGLGLVGSVTIPSQASIMKFGLRGPTKISIISVDI